MGKLKDYLMGTDHFEKLEEEESRYTKNEYSHDEPFYKDNIILDGDF